MDNDMLLLQINKTVKVNVRTFGSITLYILDYVNRFVTRAPFFLPVYSLCINATFNVFGSAIRWLMNGSANIFIGFINRFFTTKKFSKFTKYKTSVLMVFNYLYRLNRYYQRKYLLDALNKAIIIKNTQQENEQQENQKEDLSPIKPYHIWNNIDDKNRRIKIYNENNIISTGLSNIQRDKFLEDDFSIIRIIDESKIWSWSKERNASKIWSKERDDLIKKNELKNFKFNEVNPTIHIFDKTLLEEQFMFLTNKLEKMNNTEEREQESDYDDASTTFQGNTEQQFDVTSSISHDISVPGVTSSVSHDIPVPGVTSSVNGGYAKNKNKNTKRRYTCRKQKRKPI